MKTYISKTSTFKNAISKYDNAMELLGIGSDLEDAKEQVNKLETKGCVITKIEEEDEEFFIYGRDNEFKVSAFTYTDNLETEGYTMFTAKKIYSPETDGGEDPDYIVFDRNSVEILKPQPQTP